MLTSRFFCLVFVLELTGISNAQFDEDCDYESTIEPGRAAYAFRPVSYPAGKYDPGTSCRWRALSDEPINVTCHFKIPESDDCNVDVIYIKSSEGPAQYFCGTGTLFLVSTINEVVIEFFSSLQSSGGQFVCSLIKTTPAPAQDCTCGKKKPTRIVGGNETDVNEYPMMAGLVDVEKRIIYCGATIINPTQVITAAHCIIGRNMANIGVIVGEHDVTTAIDTDATQLFLISAYASHPQYEQHKNDIAIIVVNGQIQFNELVGAACLPFQHSQSLFTGEPVNLLGWGAIGFAERRSNTLQEIKVGVISPNECHESYPDTTNKHICTFGLDRDACQYDSGGPVLWMDPDTKNEVLVGIISYGRTCADESPGVSTRITEYLDWILGYAPEGYEYCMVE